MKKILFLGIILFIFPITKIYASSIYSIDMDIYVANDGTATIKEVWDANVTEGTEGWHPYYNLGNSKISDVNVSMDGKDFTTVYDWDINNSFSNKAYKASLYYADDDDVDVVFGISNYGHHIYSVSYKIGNFVSTLEDADIIYWNLFPYDFSAEPGNVNIVIYSDFDYEDTWDVWGYGKYGTPCYIYDGKIEMTSDGVISSDEYLTILAKFPKGTFNTSNVLDNDFNYYYDMAEEGAVNYNSKPRSTFEKMFEVFVSFFSIFIPFLVFSVIGFIGIKQSLKGNNRPYRFGEVGNKVRDDVPYFRDIPCNNDIYRAYWVAIQYNLISKKEDVMGSILLKWLKDGNVKVEKVEKTGIFKNKTESNIIFVNEPDSIELEKKLYNWMLESSLDGKLESNEFKKWCDKNYSKIFNWFDDLLDYEEKALIDEGKVITETVKKSVYFNVDGSMMIEAEQMAGLKKFLKDFTLIKEREPIEIHLWNEYLIYAQIFGIADKVAEQFKKLYPEIIQNMDSVGFDIDDIIFINMISHTGIVSASDARSRAASYNSGGGGFSSGFGGGGSFGGGGGGGGFR